MDGVFREYPDGRANKRADKQTTHRARASIYKWIIRVLHTNRSHTAPIARGLQESFNGVGEGVGGCRNRVGKGLCIKHNSSVMPEEAWRDSRSRSRRCLAAREVPGSIPDRDIKRSFRRSLVIKKIWGASPAGGLKSAGSIPVGVWPQRRFQIPSPYGTWGDIRNRSWRCLDVKEVSEIIRGEVCRLFKDRSRRGPSVRKVVGTTAQRVWECRGPSPKGVLIRRAS